MQTSISIGKTRRLNRLFNARTNRLLLVPLDDSLLAGPYPGLNNLREKVKLIAEYPPDAVMGFSGLFKSCPQFLNPLPGILNLTASTVRSQHTRKTLIGNVEGALRLGMEAVAVHINISSRFETEMLHIMGNISDACELVGMPLMGIMYPRTEHEDKDYNYDDLKASDPKKYTQLVAHAARVGVELGADIIKTTYTGDPESFQLIVEACDPIPVVIAGGPPLPFKAMLQMAYGAIKAGGAGISFGRNVFTRSDPRPFLSALRAIVHENLTPDEVIERDKDIRI